MSELFLGSSTFQALACEQAPALGEVARGHAKAARESRRKCEGCRELARRLFKLETFQL